MNDKVKGMLIGALLGDALGAPHEFNGAGALTYTGKLEHVTTMNSRFHGQKRLEVGQITDDGEMTLALYSVLAANKFRYDRDSVLLQGYLPWANSGGWMIGNNTRERMRGVKTLKGFIARTEKLDSEKPISEGNGCLMRASPLALIRNNWKKHTAEDCSITNSSQRAIEATVGYVAALRCALDGGTAAECKEALMTRLTDFKLLEVLNEKVSKKDEPSRYSGKDKGWLAYGLRFAVVGNMMFEGDSVALYDWIIAGHPRSDTDTNACIAGALCGAILGFEELYNQQGSNIDILLTRDGESGPTPRPATYIAKNYFP